MKGERRVGDVARTFLRCAAFAVCLPLIIEALRFDALSPFTYHPVLLCICYVWLASEALYSAAEMRAEGGDRQRTITLHFLSQSVSVLLSLIAFCIIYRDKDQRSKPHFTSLHSLIGAAALLGSVAQLLIGLYLYFFSSLCSLKGIERARRIKNTKLVHRWVGCTTFVAGFSAVLLGLGTNWAVKAVQLPPSLSIVFFLAAIPPPLVFFFFPPTSSSSSQ